MVKWGAKRGSKRKHEKCEEYVGKLEILEACEEYVDGDVDKLLAARNNFLSCNAGWISISRESLRSYPACSTNWWQFVHESPKLMGMVVSHQV